MRFNQSKLGYMERAFFPPSLILFKCGLWCANQLKNQFMICDTIRLGSRKCREPKIFWQNMQRFMSPFTSNSNMVYHEPFFISSPVCPKIKSHFQNIAMEICADVLATTRNKKKKCQRNNTKERWKREKNINLVKSAA